MVTRTADQAPSTRSPCGLVRNCGHECATMLDLRSDHRRFNHHARQFPGSCCVLVRQCTTCDPYLSEQVLTSWLGRLHQRELVCLCFLGCLLPLPRSRGSESLAFSESEDPAQRPCDETLAVSRPHRTGPLVKPSKLSFGSCPKSTLSPHAPCYGDSVGE